MPMAAAASAERDEEGRAIDAPALAELRAAVARIENAAPRFRPGAGAKTRVGVLSFGPPAADAALGGGWPRAGLAELHGSETRGMGAATGLALALAVRFGAGPGRPLVWIGTRLGFGEAGGLYAPGLRGAGLDPAALVVVDASKLSEAVWAAEEAARSGSPALTVLEARGNPALLALEGTRRLHLRALNSGAPLLLLRQNGAAEATAAHLRLRVFAHASAVPADPAARLLGPPAFRIAVEKAPGRPPTREIILEWNAHERRFAPVLPPAARVPDAGRALAFPVDRPDPAAGVRLELAHRPARRG